MTPVTVPSKITNPSIDIVVGTVFIVNDGLVVAEDVEAEARRGPVIVEEHAREKISVICVGVDKFAFKVSVDSFFFWSQLTQVGAGLPYHLGRLGRQTICLILII